MCLDRCCDLHDSMNENVLKIDKKEMTIFVKQFFISQRIKSFRSFSCDEVDQNALQGKHDQTVESRLA